MPIINDKCFFYSDNKCRREDKDCLKHLKKEYDSLYKLNYENQCKAEQQLQRLKKENEIITMENQEAKEIVAELKHENKELKEKVERLDKMTGIFSARLAEKYKQALEEIKNNCTEMLETIEEEGKPNKSIMNTIWCKNIPCCTLYELIENTQIKIDEVLK